MRIKALKIMMFVAVSMMAVSCGDDEVDFSVTPDTLVGTKWSYSYSLTDEGQIITIKSIYEFKDQTTGVYHMERQFPDNPSLNQSMDAPFTYTYTKPNGTMYIEMFDEDYEFTINGPQMTMSRSGEVLGVMIREA